MYLEIQYANITRVKSIPLHTPQTHNYLVTINLQTTIAKIETNELFLLHF